MTDVERWSREATVADLPQMRAVVDAACGRLGCSAEVTSRLILAATETCTNAIRHGYDGGPGRLDVRIHPPGDAVTLTITDHAPAFDPASVAAPTLSNDLDEREPGGLGLHLVAQMIDRVAYRDLGHGNEHTLVIEDRSATRTHGHGIVFPRAIASPAVGNPRKRVPPDEVLTDVAAEVPPS